MATRPHLQSMERRQGMRARCSTPAPRSAGSATGLAWARAPSSPKTKLPLVQAHITASGWLGAKGPAALRQPQRGARIQEGVDLVGVQADSGVDDREPRRPADEPPART